MARTAQEASLFRALVSAISSISKETVKPEAIEKLFNRLKSKTPQEFKDAYGIAKSTWLNSATGKKTKQVASKLVTAINKRTEDTVAKAGAKAGAKVGPAAVQGAEEVVERAVVEAGPARTTFGSVATTGEAGEAGAPAQRGRLDQITKLRTKLMDPDTPIRADRFTEGATRKGVVNKALNTKANKAAFAGVRQSFIDAGVKPGKDLTKLMSNIKKSPELMSKIGGGTGLGEKAIIEGARAGAPVKSAFGSKGGLMELMGMGGQSKDTVSVAALTKGVGSTAGKLVGKAFRFGIPLLAFEAFTFVPRIAREIGLDPEFNQQIDAIDTASAGFSHEALAAEYEQKKLIAKHKSRLTQEDPMAMQFLMGAMADGSLPQKLTQNEVMIGGASSGGPEQSAAGDEIARAFMGL